MGREIAEFIYLCLCEHRRHRDSKRGNQAASYGDNDVFGAKRTYARLEHCICALGDKSGGNIQFCLPITIRMVLTSPRLRVYAECTSFSSYWSMGRLGLKHKSDQLPECENKVFCDSEYFHRRNIAKCLTFIRARVVQIGGESLEVERVKRQTLKGRVYANF